MASVKQKLEDIQLKSEKTLSDFKRRNKNDFIMYGETSNYNGHIQQLRHFKDRIRKKIIDLKKEECTMTISSLMNEYNSIDTDSERLTQYMRIELDNNEKEKWYNKQFDTWQNMPPRQECKDFSIDERLKYSYGRLILFKYLEDRWKIQTFGKDLGSRLDFF
jgi:glucan-binding YG repeat protein|tara:strand:+ start:2081 stop:2566 length:486 start_codon:yes stop_codon:yes gene_type:complete